MNGEKQTVIDTDANVEGKLVGQDARILGAFRGEIAIKGRLVLGEGSRVEAKVVADVAEISGEFKGEIRVRSLMLAEKARVDGTIDAQSLAIREGAQVNAKIEAGAPVKLGAGTAAG